jgi:hypothetical protein
LERSKSLCSEQINTTYSQTLTTGSQTTVLWILALPLSSNCRSLNQTSLKGPALWHSVTIWPTTAVCCEDRREAVYTLCLPLWDDCVHCFLSVTPMLKNRATYFDSDNYTYITEIEKNLGECRTSSFMGQYQSLCCIAINYSYLLKKRTKT